MRGADRRGPDWCNAVMIVLSSVTIFQTISAAFFAIFSILLMAVILLQRGRGVGLAGAFGGAGGAATFGAKTGDILTWVTMVMFGIYVLLAVILNFVFVPAAPSLAPPAITSTTPSETGAAAPSNQPAEPATVPPTSGPAPSAAPSDGAAPPSETPPPASGPAQGLRMHNFYSDLAQLPIFGEDKVG